VTGEVSAADAAAIDGEVSDLLCKQWST
jgi:hypothetical protein